MAMNQTKSVKVSIFGDQYSFLSDEPEAQVLEAARRVDALMQEIAGKLTHPDLKKIAVLLAVQIMSKHIALESALESDTQKLKQLMDMVDREVYTKIAGRP